MRSAKGEERGTVVLLHGGSWSATGADAQATVATSARRFRRWGWRTVNADYRAGEAGMQDVLRAVDKARDRGGPVCIYGESAGGHWALMAAAERDVDCVIALAAPTELERVPAWSTLGQVAASAFGADRATYSPVRRAADIAASVLLAYGADDTVVPLFQGLSMRAALGDADLEVLQRGEGTWVHGSASTAAVVALLAQQRDLLDAAAS